MQPEQLESAMQCRIPNQIAPRRIGIPGHDSDQCGRGHNHCKPAQKRARPSVPGTRLTPTRKGKACGGGARKRDPERIFGNADKERGRSNPQIRRKMAMAASAHPRSASTSAIRGRAAGSRRMAALSVRQVRWRAPGRARSRTSRVAFRPFATAPTSRSRDTPLGSGTLAATGGQQKIGVLEPQRVEAGVRMA